jgi:hypothetical protein
MRFQSPGDGAVRTGYRGLAAGCPRCNWLDASEKAIALAESHQLLCSGCNEDARIFYIRPRNVETKLPEGVHEEVASGQKATK